MIKIKNFLEDYHGQLAVNTLITSDFTETFFLTLYSDFSWIMDSATLKAVWDMYLIENLENLKRAYNALMVEYNPIENYNRKEKITVNHNNRQTNNTTDTQTIGEKTITDNTSAYNSTTYQPNNQTKEDSYTDTLEKTGTIENVGSDVTINETSGNIGVTTSQQMIESELTLRKTHLFSDFLERFARRYFIYVSEV